MGCGDHVAFKTTKKSTWFMNSSLFVIGPCSGGGYLATAVSVPISSSAPIMDVAKLVHGAWQGAADICTTHHYCGQLANYPGVYILTPA